MDREAATRKSPRDFCVRKMLWITGFSLFAPIHVHQYGQRENIVFCVARLCSSARRVAKRGGMMGGANRGVYVGGYYWGQVHRVICPG